MKTKQRILCPCNSGRSYSSCCLSKKIVIFDPRWQKLRKTAKKVIYQYLVSYVETLGFDLMNEAWFEFWEDEKKWPEGVLGDCLETVFIPWLLFQRNHEGKGAIALHYLKQYQDRLNDDEQCFIQAACKTHYDFYVVLDTIPGLHLELKSLLLQSHHIIREPQLSEVLTVGDILFMSLLEVDGQSVCLGMSPYGIPSNYYQMLLQFRKHLQKQGKLSLSLKGSSEEIKNEFLRILKTLLNAIIGQEKKYELNG